MTSKSPRRSALYMPASNERALAKARHLSADMILMDLEDAVAPEAKADARTKAVAAINEGGYGHREVVLRLNGPTTQEWAQDLELLSVCKPDALLVPKVNAPEDVTRICDAINHYDPAGRIGLWLMMETPAAVLHASGIAGTVERFRRLQGFVIGTNDLIKDTGVATGLDRINLLSWLMTIVAAAKANGLDVFDGVYNDLSDEDGFVRECAQGQSMGMTGKTLIHPKQIAPCNAQFSPSSAEIDFAKCVVEAFESNDARGKGAILVQGKMVERLHLDMAQAVLARAAALEGAAA